MVLLKTNQLQGALTKKHLLLLGFIAVKFFLQYHLISPEYELQRDEFLHLDQAHHLAWGYVSIPPFTSWISSIILFLGNTVFWIKFFPALFGALTLLIVWKAIEELKGNLFALTLGATAILFSVLLRLNILYQPNSFDVLCWTGFYFMLIKYINSTQKKWLFGAAIVFALGFLNKYNIIFLLIGLLPALLLTKQRTIFTKSAFYWSLTLTLLLILPNLVWQYLHHFPVFYHLKELNETQLIHVDRWIFLKEQLFFFAGSLFILFGALYALLCYKVFEKFSFFFWTFCFTLFVFIYFKAKGYYAIGLYPIYIAFGSVYLETLIKSGWKRYLRPIALLIPVVLFIPMYQFVFPNKSPDYILNHAALYQKLGLLRWEDGKDHILPQDFADMLGWKELADKVATIYADLPNKDQILILCDNYGQAGAINYYAHDKRIAAVSFNADYLNWFKLDKPYIHLIRVKNQKGQENELAETSPYFESAFIGGSVNNPFAREYGTTIFVFKKAKIGINEKISAEIAEHKHDR